MVSEYYWAKSLEGTKGVRHNDPKHFNEWVQRQLVRLRNLDIATKGIAFRPTVTLMTRESNLSITS